MPAPAIYGHKGQPDAMPPVKRTAKPSVNALEVFRDNFAHWLHDETQDPKAQRAFRMLLRAVDPKLRMEAWKLAATILGPSNLPKEPGKVVANFDLRHGLARPKTVKPVIETTAEPERDAPE